MKLLAVFLLGLSLILPGQLMAAPEFAIYQEQLQATITSFCGDSWSFSFLLFAKGGPMANFQGQVLEVKDPEGGILPSEIVTVSPESTSISPVGTRIRVSLPAQCLVRSGAYSILLRFEAPDVTPLIQKITINQPSPAVNLEELSGLIFRLVRPWPLGAASGEETLFLRETTGNAAVRRLEVYADAILLENSRILTSGRVTVTLPENNQLAPGSQIPLGLKLEGLERAGVLTTHLTLNSPSFKNPVRLPLNIQVADAWGYPLLVIFLGVLGGFFLSYLVKTWKPRQKNEIRLARFKDILERLDIVTTDSQRQVTLFEIRQKLLAADEKNLEDAAAARALLDQIQTDLGKFSLERAKLGAGAQKQIKDLTVQIQQYLAPTISLTGDEKQLLTSLVTSLKESEKHLARDELDQALEILHKTEGDFKEFRKRYLTKEVKSKETEIEEISQKYNLASAEEKNLTDLLKEIRSALEKDLFDEAQTKLQGLDEAIAAIHRKHVMGFKALPKGRPLLDAQKLREAETAIEIDNAPENCTNESSITFHIRGKLAQEKNCLVQWNFGDGTRSIQGGMSESHWFRESRPFPYHVQATIKRDDEVLKTLSYLITILSGEKEKYVIKLGRMLKSADFAISGMAVVLASLTGLLYLSLGKPFGTPQDYLLAFLWGFGIDNSVRGFSEVFKIINK